VLDNCEHLLDGIDLVADLLAAAPQVKVMATSREPLNLHEEWLYSLGGMSFPGDEDPITSGTVADLAEYTAVQLFVQCARRMQSAFDLAQEGEMVARICQTVGGMPLGIEMASSWLKHFSCTQIATELERNLDFLATTLRNVPARHRSMRAVFAHSWSLLSEAEQQVLQRLAVFRGGFRLEAAQHVAEASFPLLVSLAEKSLVQPSPSGRYQLHELLRQFAEEKLRADLYAYAEVQNRHCHYYTTFLEQQEVHLKGAAHLAATEAIKIEIENIRAAWTRAVAQDDLDALARALESLSYFHDTQCWYEQGMGLFRSTAEALNRRPADDRRQLLFARMLLKQAQMQHSVAFTIGRYELDALAKQLMEQSLSIFQSYGESTDLGDVLWGLSHYLLETAGEYDRGQQLRQRSVAIYERLGDRWRIARAMDGLGYAANLHGQHEEAMRYYRRGIALCEEIGAILIKGDILNIFGEAHRALGEYEEANRLAQAALEARTAAGNKRGIAYSLYLLGDLAWRMGNLEEALRYSQQSRDLFVEIGLLAASGFALNNLGNIACTMGDYSEARRQFLQILQSNLERNFLNSELVPWALVGLAEVLRQEGHPAQAIELIEQVLHHPNAWQEAKDRAAKLFAQLAADLPAETVASAQAQVRDLRTVMVELLKPLGSTA
jgi:predicted ATPase